MVKNIIAAVLFLSFMLATVSGCTSGSGSGGTPTPAPATAAPTTAAATATPAPTAAPEEPDDAFFVDPAWGDLGGLTLPITTEDVTITWLTTHDNVDLSNRPVLDEIKRRTGVYIEWINIPSDGLTEKANTYIASGNMPNILPNGSTPHTTLGEQGAFIALNQYLDELPNLKSYIFDDPENNWYVKAYSSDNGNLFAWPKMQESRIVNHMFMYRKDIFDKHNIPVWDFGDTDGFYDALKQLKEIYPDSVPYSSKMAQYLFQYIGAGWGLTNNTWPWDYVEADGKWRFVYTTDEMKQLIDFLQKMYADGLLDPEFYTCTAAAWIAKMSEPETTFVSFDWVDRLNMFYDTVKDEIPGYDLQGAPPVGPTGKTYRNAMFYPSMCVSKTTANWREAMLLLDYLTSPSGAELATIGIEGEWFYWDADGRPVYTVPELEALDTINHTELAIYLGVWGGHLNMRSDRRSIYHQLTPKVQAITDIIIAKDAFIPSNPILSFGDEAREDIAEILTPLRERAEEFCATYISNSGHGSAEWDAWLATAKAMRVDRALELHDEAQTAYDSK